MKLHRDSKFYSQPGSTTVPAGCVAVAIHPSSEVDMVRVGGYLVSVGAIVPLAGSGGEVIEPARGRPQYDVDNGDQQLVLQYYEKCDSLVPPGARAPVMRTAALDASAVGADRDNATLAFRLPFAGRRQATLHFNGAVAPDIETAGANFGAVASETVHFGGGGDDQEDFDELLVFVYGTGSTLSVAVVGAKYGRANDVGPGEYYTEAEPVDLACDSSFLNAYITAEAYGERVL